MQIENLTNLINKTNIRAFVTTNDFIKGKQYDKNKITLKSEKEKESLYSSLKVFSFEVDSETKPTYYDVTIILENNKEIVRTTCDCKAFRNFQSCKHIGAVFVNYYEQIFKGNIINVNKITNEILNKFIPKEESLIKKELQVQLYINITERESYYYYARSFMEYNVKILIGEDKLYTLGNHANAFKSAYETGCGEVYFGKNFTFIPEKYYLSNESKTIIESYLDICEGYYNKSISSNMLKKFLDKIKNTKFVVNNYQIEGIKDGFPIDTNLVKRNNSYELNFDLENVECLIENDYEYILYKGKLYHLNNKEQSLIEDLIENNLDKLLITKDKVDTFTKGLLGIVRKNLKIDSSVNDIVLPNEINTKLYFDLRSSYILLDIIFKYDDKEINYLDKSNEVLRDISYETKVINDLLKYGFILEKDKIILKDIEAEVKFLEEGLEELATRYEIFTTEKFKNINIKKKTSISSMFRIGQDNILSYNFNIGDINSDELVNIFANMKDRKKYYRLKNGNILNLEDESLKELTNMFEGSKYITLTKTYRSTDKIIDYTNKILGLTLSVAIRNQKSNDIIFRNNVKKEDFIKDINYLKEMSKSIAIITKDDKEAEEVYNMLKDDFDIMLLGGYGHIKRDLVIVPSYTAKGLEFDSVIIYNDMDNKYTKEDKYLYYVACTRAQHNLIIYNGEE